MRPDRRALGMLAWLLRLGLIKAAVKIPGFKGELPFAVEEWNATTGGYVRDIARSSNLKVATGRVPSSGRRVSEVAHQTSQPRPGPRRTPASDQLSIRRPLSRTSPLDVARGGVLATAH